MKKFLAAVLLTVITGCGGSHTSTIPSGESQSGGSGGGGVISTPTGTLSAPPSTSVPTPVATSATSVPVASATVSPGSLYTALGDSLSAGYGLANPSTEAWPALVAVARDFKPDDLAISGATTESMLQLQVPNVLATTAVVTILIGSNNQNAIAFGRDTQAAANSAYISALREIETTAPAARIMLVTPPDSSLFAAGYGATEGVTFTGAEIAAAHTSFLAFETLIKGQGLPVCDLGNNSEYYASANFESDTIHPNTVGSAFIANAIEACLTTNGI